MKLPNSEIFLPNYNATPLEKQEDFVGPLSGTEGDSLVEYLFTKFNLKTYSKSNIEKSRTGVWLKYDQAAVFQLLLSLQFPPLVLM